MTFNPLSPNIHIQIEGESFFTFKEERFTTAHSGQ